MRNLALKTVDMPPCPEWMRNLPIGHPGALHYEDLTYGDVWNALEADSPMLRRGERPYAWVVMDRLVNQCVSQEGELVRDVWGRIWDAHRANEEPDPNDIDRMAHMWATWQQDMAQFATGLRRRMIQALEEEGHEVEDARLRTSLSVQLYMSCWNMHVRNASQHMDRIVGQALRIYGPRE
jgi:hypothetical protein